LSGIGGSGYVLFKKPNMNVTRSFLFI